MCADTAGVYGSKAMQRHKGSFPARLRSPAFRLVVFVCLLCLPGLCAGATEAGDGGATSVVPRPALMDLARQFVNRVGGGMAKADAAMGLGGQNSSAKASVLPEGTELLLQARVGRDVFAGDMLAVQHDGQLFVSLSEFFGVLGFPLRIDSGNKQAEGWFIRETRPFRLDAAAGRVVVGEKAFSLNPSSLRVEEEDWSVAVDALEVWLDATLNVDAARQMMEIVSAEPLPVQARAARRSRRLPQNSETPPARLSLQESPVKLLEQPFVDVSMNAQVRRSASGQPYSRNAGYSVLTSGDLGGMTLKTFSASDLREGLNSVRVSALKTSENPDLLGPIKAREVEIGDLSPVRVPLAGSSGQEQGVRLTNRKGDQSVSFAATRIEGDAQPGWDVELYRDDQIVGLQEADETGRYVFDNVRLLAGNNDFRLVFYGLNGERREEKRTVAVDLNAATSAGGVWAVSATRRNKTTYDRQRSIRSEDGEVQLAATYERGLGQSVLANAGLRSVPQGEARKTYLESGVSTVLGGAILTSNVAYDLDGEAAAEVIARRNLGSQRLGAQVQVNTNRWAPGGSDTNPTVLDAGAQISGPLGAWGGTHLGYSVEGNYAELAEDQRLVSVAQNLNLSSGPWRINNTVEYEKRTGFSTEERPEEIQNTVSLGYFSGKDQFRASALYEIAPDAGMASVFASWLRKYSPALSSEVEIERYLESGLNRVEGKLNWRHDRFTLSPRVELDSDGRVVAALGARTGFATDPHSGEHIFRGRTLTGGGGISARVFIDNDGNGVFNTGDEVVEGVRVSALQARRRAQTGVDGIAFLLDIPAGRATDVMIDRDTLPDPILLPSREGVSVLPRSGHADAVDLPVTRSGELDGTVFLDPPRRAPYPAAGVRLYLYDLAGRKKAFTTTAYDGFYLFSMVPPGDYYLLPAPEDLALLRAESPLPRKVRIGYEGTVLYGQDVTLSVTDDPGATLAIAEGPGDYLIRNVPESLKDFAHGRVVLDLGAYRSRLLMALVWYRLKTRYGALLAGSELLVRPSESLPDSDNMHLLRVAQTDPDPDQARRLCRTIAARGIGCRVTLIPGTAGLQAALEGKKGG